MKALQLVADWPVRTVAAAVVGPDGVITTTGPTDHSFRLASVTKMLSSWAILVACEEGTLHLDLPVGQEGCTLRHLLSHAGGYAFDGSEPITRPGSRRIYSNTGIEMAATALAVAADMPFEQYLREAVLSPLGMAATVLSGSPAHGARSTVGDLLRFVDELLHPQLLSTETALSFRTVQFPGLPGLVPGVGRYDDCPWGLGTEIRGDKHPHWTGTHNSHDTFGHFGGAGTLLWVEPGAHIACLALTDRPFNDWAPEALRLWPELSDAVLAEVAA